MIGAGAKVGVGTGVFVGSGVGVSVGTGVGVGGAGVGVTVGTAVAVGRTAVGVGSGESEHAPTMTAAKTRIANSLNYKLAVPGADPSRPRRILAGSAGL